MEESDAERTLSRRGLTPVEISDHAYREAGHAVAAIRLGFGLGLAGKVGFWPQSHAGPANLLADGHPTDGPLRRNA